MKKKLLIGIGIAVISIFLVPEIVCWFMAHQAMKELYKEENRPLLKEPVSENGIEITKLEWINPEDGDVFILTEIKIRENGKVFKGSVELWKRVRETLWFGEKIIWENVSFEVMDKQEISENNALSMIGEAGKRTLEFKVPLAFFRNYEGKSFAENFIIFVRDDENNVLLEYTLPIGYFETGVISFRPQGYYDKERKMWHISEVKIVAKNKSDFPLAWKHAIVQVDYQVKENIYFPGVLLPGKIGEFVVPLNLDIPEIAKSLLIDFGERYPGCIGTGTESVQEYLQYFIRK